MGTKLGSDLHSKVRWYDQMPIWMMTVDPDDINGIQDLADKIRDYFHEEQQDQPWVLAEETLLISTDEVTAITMLP